ncbi:MAG: GyrI-like domain-containing protein [Dehalobacterium sp.]|jgi:effector-binding domain-containing protein
MSYQFLLSEEPTQWALAMRTRTAVTNLPQELGIAYNSIMEYLASLGEETSGPAFAAYYNMDMEDLDVAMGFIVPKFLPGKDSIYSHEIPSGKQVSYLYQGPYSQMAPVYDAMASWMQENNLTPTGICYEFYYNSPMDVPESELLTKIVFPLK